MVRTKIICEKCGREISKSNFTKHLRSHETHPENFEKETYHLDHDDLFCKFCGKECKNKNSLVQHEIRCKENPNKINACISNFNNIGRIAWNKGLTKETDERVKQRGLNLHNNVKSGKTIFKGHIHSEETKEKLSTIRKKYLSENPDKVPYLINHSSKTSYPEKYFMELFEKENINLKYHHMINKYELDFCDLDKKVDIEVDGEQHYVDKRIVNSDKDRDEFLKNLGWEIFRIRWSDYQKLSLQERKEVINNIKNIII